MSVEEARDELEECIVQTARHGQEILAKWLANRRTDPTETYGNIDIKVDRLILEVQAEMPCEFRPDGQTCNDVHRFPYDDQPCRSCKAKAQLAAEKVTADPKRA